MQATAGHNGDLQIGDPSTIARPRESTLLHNLHLIRYAFSALALYYFSIRLYYFSQAHTS